MNIRRFLLWASVASFGPSSLSATLVAYYNFNDGSATDGSGNGNNGALIGAPGFSSVDIPGALGSGQAILLNGSGQRVEIPHGPSLAFAGGELTISLWLRSTSSNNFERILSKNAGALLDPGFEIQRDGNRPNAELRLDTSAQGNQIFEVLNAWNSEWTHLAYAVKDGVVTSWVNGVPASVNGGGNTSYNLGGGFGNTDDLILGSRSNGLNPFTGLLDDVALWDTALTDTQIANLAAGASPTSIPEPSSLGLLALASLTLLRRRR